MGRSHFVLSMQFDKMFQLGLAGTKSGTDGSRLRQSFRKSDALSFFRLKATSNADIRLLYTEV
jgi:hypothetical protein